VILRRIFGRADEQVSFDGWIVVGLGNPGPKYEQTRHNVGYLVTDELATRMGGRWKQSRSGRAVVIEGRLAGQPGVRAVLGRTHGYMNESGGPMSGLLKFYKAEPAQLVVVHDEIDLPYGDIRVKFGGGDNGHNGLKSVRKALGTGDYFRVRLGVGRPPGRQEPADWVLKPFGSAERRELDLHIVRTADAVESLITVGLERTQNTFNS
jgi:PTH1 family peptidyl-tRNA hydrolase